MFYDLNIIFVFKTTVTRAEAPMEAAQAWAVARSVVDSECLTQGGTAQEISFQACSTALSCSHLGIIS